MNLLPIIVGTLTGILSGLGIGGGSLLVLYLTAVGGISPYYAGGINLLYFIGCAPMALWGHLRNKQVHIQTVLWCTLGGLSTVFISSWIASRMEIGLLKRLFGILLLFIAVLEWHKESTTQ